MARYAVFLDHEAALSIAAMPGEQLKEVVDLLMRLADDPFTETHPIEASGPEHERIAGSDAAIVTFVVSESAHAVTVLTAIWVR